MNIINDFWNKKIPLFYLGWAFIFFNAFLLNMCSSKLHYKKAYENECKERLNEINKSIKFKEEIVKKHQQEIQLQNQRILKLNNQVDSLNKLKSKVEIRYRKEIEKIKQMDANEINNYWNEEFD